MLVMTKTTTRKIESLTRRLADERKWYADHGGSRARYVERYGSVNDPDHYGAGGEAIHEADAAAITKIELELARLGVFS